MKKLLLLVGLVFLTSNVYAEKKYFYDGEWALLNNLNPYKFHNEQICEDNNEFIPKLTIKKNRITTPKDIKGKVKYKKWNDHTFFLKNKDRQYEGKFKGIFSLDIFSKSNKCFSSYMKISDHTILNSNCINNIPKITCFCKRPDNTTFSAKYIKNLGDHCSVTKYNNEEISFGQYLFLNNDSNPFKVSYRALHFKHGDKIVKYIREPRKLNYYERACGKHNKRCIARLEAEFKAKNNQRGTNNQQTNNQEVSQGGQVKRKSSDDDWPKGDYKSGFEKFLSNWGFKYIQTW